MFLSMNIVNWRKLYLKVSNGTAWPVKGQQNIFSSSKLFKKDIDTATCKKYAVPSDVIIYNHKHKNCINNTVGTCRRKVKTFK